MRVSLFITCLADQLHPEVGVSTVRVLRRLGCDVRFSPRQTCCGQPFHNAGAVAEARRVARTWHAAFDDLAADEWIVTPSGSCAAMVRQGFAELFAEDAEEAARARALAKRTREFSEFLVGVLGVEDVGASLARRATYHPSCHATRLLGIGDAPERLLARVRGLELLPLAHAGDCCGFGGMFSVKLPHVSTAMAGEKLEHVAAAGAQVLVGTDMGCLAHLGGMLRARGAPIETLHLAQVLDSGHAAR